ncbi:hypothetical protein EVAR_85148_1 [Eumeta japonica]|uniref:Uncharacterized protein n=1 Tax=Eumeta variegata TaxID=151549 RepID=A0A4C1XRT3_EUMVA|nr:hypothetical protein EVAR_85148_1 [Eumeta japonica]
MLGNPLNDEVLNGVYEQNLRVKYPTLTTDKFKAACGVAFKKSRRDRPVTTVVLECTPELRDVLVSMDRLYIGWEAVIVCDYIDVTCCHNCQQQLIVRGPSRAALPAIGSDARTPSSTALHLGIAPQGVMRKSGSYPLRNMDRLAPLRVGQINLGSSIVATRELAEVARRERLDFVLVQEQYAAADNIVQTGADSKAGLLLVKTDIAVTALAHMSNSHCLVAHVGPCDLYLISCYFQYRDSIDPHLDHLGRDQFTGTE